MRLFLMLLTAITLACSQPGLTVSRAEYGDHWPFTIDSGRLMCQRESQRSRRLIVTLERDGIAYGLNGSAISFGFLDGRTILRSGFTGADMQPIIERGLALCR